MKVERRDEGEEGTGCEKEAKKTKGNYSFICQVKNDKDLSYLVSAVMKYSWYSWSTWFVLKIFIKLTTYSLLKARDMEEEAHKWITDWGPIVNPFIDYVFLPLSRIVLFFYNQMEAFSDDD